MKYICRFVNICWCAMWAWCCRWKFGLQDFNMTDQMVLVSKENRNGNHRYICDSAGKPKVYSRVDKNGKSNLALGKIDVYTKYKNSEPLHLLHHFVPIFSLDMILEKFLVFLFLRFDASNLSTNWLKSLYF